MKGLDGIKKKKWFKLGVQDSRSKRRNKEVPDEGQRRSSDLLIVDKAQLEIRNNFLIILAASAWKKIPEALSHSHSQR